MQITNVQFTRLRNPQKKGSKLKIAYASITLDDCLVINSIKVLQNEKNGHYDIVMPSHPLGKTSRRDTCFPITNQFRLEMTNKIIEGYKNMI